MKVYLLTIGEYSNYHVVNVYSTLEKADEALRWVEYDKTARIEVFELDGTPNYEDYIYSDVKSKTRRDVMGYVIFMNRDGDTKDGCDIPSLPDYSPSWKGYTRLSTGEDGIYLNAQITAPSFQHAVKIANEVRTKLIAEGHWDDFAKSGKRTQEYKCEQ